MAVFFAPYAPRTVNSARSLRRRRLLGLLCRRRPSNHGTVSIAQLLLPVTILPCPRRCEAALGLLPEGVADCSTSTTALLLLLLLRYRLLGSALRCSARSTGTGAARTHGRRPAAWGCTSRRRGGSGSAFNLALAAALRSAATAARCNGALFRAAAVAEPRCVRHVEQLWCTPHPRECVCAQAVCPDLLNKHCPRGAAPQCVATSPLPASPQKPPPQRAMLHRLRWHDPPAIAEADAFDDALDCVTLPARREKGGGGPRLRLGWLLGRPDDASRAGQGSKHRPAGASAPARPAARRGAVGGGREGGVAAQTRPSSSSGGGRASGRRVVHHLIAGAVAGATAKTVEAPLDRVKIIFQVSKQRFSFAAAAKQMGIIAKTEGLSGLWKGNGACVATAARCCVEASTAY